MTAWSPRTHRRPLRPPPVGITAAGLALIVLAVSLAAALPLSPLQITALTAVVAIVVGWAVIAAQWRRSRQWQRRLRDREAELSQWRQRWQTLRMEKQQNAAVLHQMTDGVIVLAPDRSIEAINPAARRLLALRHSGSLRGRWLAEAVRVPEILQAVQAAAEQAQAQELAIEIADRDHVRPLKLRVEPVRRGAESDLLLTLRDQTQARRVEEIRRMFVANVSHELKTPLAAIKGYAETVEMAIGDDPEAARHFMSQIRGQCQRLETLIEDMMQLARAQAGPQTLNLAPLAWSDIISESFQTSVPIAEAEGVSLSAREADPLARVTADYRATLTIANNLIHNAIRYTPPGGHVRVGVRREDDHWALVVEDDGVGIAESDQERIFERFYRADQTPRSTGGGTGLGLAIVKNLVVAQSGTVTVQSVPGEGSTFEVWLPAAPSAP